VNAADLCTLTVRFVQSSAAYQVVEGGCSVLTEIGPRLRPGEKQTFVEVYQAAVQALVRPGWLAQAQATALANLANAL
jgi:hypothetical protein